MVKLSIIIPLYNGASYIRNSIESIEDVNVGIKDALEIIVVDDGSTDDGRIEIVPNNVHRFKQLYAHKGYVSKMLKLINGKEVAEEDE